MTYNVSSGMLNPATGIPYQAHNKPALTETKSLNSSTFYSNIYSGILYYSSGTF